MGRPRKHLDLPPGCTRKRRGARTYIYFRAGDGAWVRLPDPTDPEFWPSYHRARDAAPRNRAAQAGTIEHLVRAFLASAEFEALAAGTKANYRRDLDALRQDLGDLPATELTREVVLIIRDGLAATPTKANHRVAVISRLMAFATDRPSTFGVTINPATRVKKLPTACDTHRPWAEDEVAAYRQRWPADSVERIAFELLLCTGQRAGDVARMTRDQYQNGWITVRQSKTGTMVDVPAAAALRAVIHPWLASHDHLAVLVRQGRPLTIHEFRGLLSRAYRAANLDGVTTHGLRYTAATILKEQGVAWEDIGAVTGHRTAEMVRHYTRRRRRAAAAIASFNAADKEANKNGT